MCCCEEHKRRLHLGTLIHCLIQDLVSFGLPDRNRRDSSNFECQRRFSTLPLANEHTAEDVLLHQHQVDGERVHHVLNEEVDSCTP